MRGGVAAMSTARLLLLMFSILAIHCLAQAMDSDTSLEGYSVARSPAISPFRDDTRPFDDASQADATEAAGDAPMEEDGSGDSDDDGDDVTVDDEGEAAVDEMCTPFIKPAPLVNFDASTLSGVWFEIATSKLPRATSQRDCVCSFINFTSIHDPKVKQEIGGRALFDVYASCNKLNASGVADRKIGQMIQIDAIRDKSSFQMFLLPAILKDGKLEVATTSPQQPPSPSPPPPASAESEVPSQRVPLTPSTNESPASVPRQPVARPLTPPSQPPLSALLHPNAVVIKSVGSANQQSILFSGPCMETVWVVSRSAAMASSDYSELMEAARAAGIDLNKAALARTSHRDCAPPAFP